MDKFLNKKKKGFAITLEVIASMFMFCLLMLNCTNIMLSMQRQKFMFNALMSGVSQTARWGGTNNTMYKTYSKTGMSIKDNMLKEIYIANPDLPAGSVSLSISPDNVSLAGENIHGTITWPDRGWVVIGANTVGGHMHTLTLDTESIVTKGKLLTQP